MAKIKEMQQFLYPDSYYNYYDVDKINKEVYRNYDKDKFPTNPENKKAKINTRYGLKKEEHMQ